MKHKEIKNKLEAFYDGELPSGEREEISAHAVVCAECRDALSRLERLGAAFSKAVRPESSEFFVTQVMRRLPQEEGYRSERAGLSPHPFLRWALPLAGYAFALLLVVMVLLPRESALTTETILLADAPEGMQRVLSNEPLDVSQLFNNMKEGMPT